MTGLKISVLSGNSLSPGDIQTMVQFNTNETGSVQTWAQFLYQSPVLGEFGFKLKILLTSKLRKGKKKMLFEKARI